MVPPGALWPDGGWGPMGDHIDLEQPAPEYSAPRTVALLTGIAILILIQLWLAMTPEAASSPAGTGDTANVSGPAVGRGGGGGP